MKEARHLEVVFLTNFSDYCYRSIPTIAQLADDFPIRLTLVHSTMDRQPSAEDRAKLDSFFPEADSYPYCQRMALKGDPVDAVKRLTMIHPVDLLIAPASDPLGLPRFWHQSLRARLLRETKIPLWTMDRRTDGMKLRKRTQHVGCWIDFHGGWASHIGFATEYAAAVGGELHILHALPEICDGLGARYDEPLSRAGVIDVVKRAMGPSPVPAQFHVAECDSRRTRIKLLEKAGVDVVFAADMNPRLPAWFAPNPRLMSESICPVVHVPVDTPVPVWRLAQDRSAPAMELVYSMSVRR